MLKNSVLSLIALTLLLAAAPVAAQTCAQPLCGSNETYAQGGERGGQPYGVCRSRPNWLGYQSHRLVECPSGRTLNRSNGQCVDDSCSRGCGQIRPICPAGERYQSQGADRQGPYAVCGSRSGIGGYKSHQIVRCQEGWRLLSGGRCQKECKAVVGLVTQAVQPAVSLTLLPDLVIKRAYLRTLKRKRPVKSVKYGKPYLVCYTVTNRGNAKSGPFRLGGGGLGVRTAPFKSYARLAAGASRQGCLRYPTTPRAGRYTLGLKVDSMNAVRESRENNNTRNLAIKVAR